MPAVTLQQPGNGTSSILTTIPGNGLDVETVYVEIDTSGAGGAVTAELLIQDQSGAVIARKPQGSTIPAGGTGSATWALRLDDESAGGGGGTLTATTGIYTCTPKSCTKNTTTSLDLTYSSGAALLDLTTTTDPTVITAGVYAFLFQARVVIALGGAPTGGSMHACIINAVPNVEALSTLTYPTAAGTIVPQWSTATVPAQVAAGATYNFRITNGDNAANRVYDSPRITVVQLSVA